MMSENEQKALSAWFAYMEARLVKSINDSDGEQQGEILNAITAEINRNVKNMAPAHGWQRPHAEIVKMLDGYIADRTAGKWPYTVSSWWGRFELGSYAITSKGDVIMFSKHFQPTPGSDNTWVNGAPIDARSRFDAISVVFGEGAIGTNTTEGIFTAHPTDIHAWKTSLVEVDRMIDAPVNESDVRKIASDMIAEYHRGQTGGDV